MKLRVFTSYQAAGEQAGVHFCEQYFHSPQTLEPKVNNSYNPVSTAIRTFQGPTHYHETEKRKVTVTPTFFFFNVGDWK
jgi:hypothetical protein